MELLGQGLAQCHIIIDQQNFFARRHHHPCLVPGSVLREGSALNLDPTPERDMVLDRGSRLFRIGIVPCGIAVFDAIDHNRMVMGRTLPGTDGSGMRWLKIFAADGVGWKVDVPFDQFEAVTFSDHLTIPDGLRHVILLLRTGTGKPCQEGTWAAWTVGKPHGSFREDGAQEKTRTST